MAYQYDPRDFADPRIEEMRQESELAHKELAEFNRYRNIQQVTKDYEMGKISKAAFNKFMGFNQPDYTGFN